MPSLNIVDIRELQYKHELLPECEAASFAYEVLDILLAMNEELNYYESILDGSWPQAKEILLKSLKKAEEYVAQDRENEF